MIVFQDFFFLPQTNKESGVSMPYKIIRLLHALDHDKCVKEFIVNPYVNSSRRPAGACTY